MTILYELLKGLFLITLFAVGTISVLFWPLLLIGNYMGQHELSSTAELFWLICLLLGALAYTTRKSK